ncbi:MAG: hypothetical protein R3B48_16825 [Kofleriaceae bacterium]
MRPALVHGSPPAASSALVRAAARLALVALLAGAVFALPACSSGPSASDCEALREKLVELEFAAMGAKATSETRDQLAKQKKDTNEGVAERFGAACTKKTPKVLIDCMLRATSLEAVKLCDTQK